MHAEVWAMFSYGPGGVGRTKVDPDKLNVISATPPVMRGPIDYLNGEAPKPDGTKYTPGCVRDELEPDDAFPTLTRGTTGTAGPALTRTTTTFSTLAI